MTISRLNKEKHLTNRPPLSPRAIFFPRCHGKQQAEKTKTKPDVTTTTATTTSSIRRLCSVLIGRNLGRLLTYKLGSREDEGEEIVRTSSVSKSYCERKEFGKFMDSNLCQFDEFKIHLSHFFNDFGQCVAKEDNSLECMEQVIDTFEENTFSFIKTFN